MYWYNRILPKNNGKRRGGDLSMQVLSSEIYISLWDAVGLSRETTAVSHTYITIFISVKSSTIWRRLSGCVIVMVCSGRVVC